MVFSNYLGQLSCQCRSILQIPQSIRQIYHNVPFCNRNVHISVTEWRIVGNGEKHIVALVRLVDWYLIWQPTIYASVHVLSDPLSPPILISYLRTHYLFQYWYLIWQLLSLIAPSPVPQYYMSDNGLPKALTKLQDCDVAIRKCNLHVCQVLPSGNSNHDYLDQKLQHELHRHSGMATIL